MVHTLCSWCTLLVQRGGGDNCGLPCCSKFGGSKLLKVGGLGFSKFKYQYVFRYNQHKVMFLKEIAIYGFLFYIMQIEIKCR